MHYKFLNSFICPLLLSISLFGCAATANDAAYLDAVEIKLKCRELADQLLATMPNDALQGLVAMPTSFVDQNDTSRTSALGRLIGETLFYEFNQRGFPTREYRLTGNISVEGGRNDLALIADKTVAVGQKWAALVVGTYYVDKAATFINARLVRTTDGLVLRTGQLVLVNTPIVQRMNVSEKPVRKQLPSPPPNAGKKILPKQKPRASAKKSTGKQDGVSQKNTVLQPYPPLYTPASSIKSDSIPIVQGK